MDGSLLSTVRDIVLGHAEDTLARASALAWRKTPLGRFYGAIRDLAEVGYLDESDRLEGIYRRSLAEAGPLDVAAVGAALTILNPIAGSTAREARGALAEMLMNVGRGV